MMDVKIDELIRHFHEMADDSRQNLQSILDLISGGRVPDARVMDQMNDVVKELRNQYNDICQAAVDTLPKEELPPEGSTADAYAEAIQNSLFSEYRKQLDAMRETLKQFASVQSLVKVYTDALVPYQEEARELMKKIDAMSSVQESDVAALEEKTTAPTAFLKALAYKDYDTDESLDHLKAVLDFYSYKVHVGLAGHQYFLPEPTELTLETQCNTTEQAEVDAKLPENAEQALAEAEKEEKADDPVPEDVVQAEEEKTEEEWWRKLGIEDPQKYLYAVSDDVLTVEEGKNSDKKFSVSKFEKEIRAHGQFAENRDVLIRIWKAGCAEAGTLDFIYQHLLDLGYLKKYTVQGYPSFYTLTARGERIFSTQSSAKLLRVPQDKTTKVRIPDSAANALARVLLLRAFTLAWTTMGDEIGVEQNVNTNSFFLHIYHKKDDECCFFAGIVGDAVASFEEFSRAFLAYDKPETLRNGSLCIVLGVNKEHAQRMAEFMDKNFHDALCETKLCYYDFETGICCSYADGATVELKKSEAAPELASADSESENAAAEAEDAVSEPAVSEDDQTNIELESDNAEPEPDDAESEAAVPENDQSNAELEADDAEAESAVSEDDQTSAEQEDDTEPALPARSEPEDAWKSGSVIASSQENAADLRREEHRKTLREMIVQEKFDCAAAYLRALDNKYTGYHTLCEQLSYALNDPAAHCSYNSAQIISTYLNADDMEERESFAIAATLRNFFYDQCQYDAQVSSLYDSLQGSALLNDHPELKAVLHILKEFKTRQQHGYDRYADYRLKKGHHYDTEKKRICSMAQRYYQSYVLDEIHEKSPNGRFLETLKLIFRNSEYSMLQNELKLVSEGSTDAELLELIRIDLRDKYIKEGCPFGSENLDLQKVDAEIDRAWVEAAKHITLVKKSDNLIGSLKTKLRNRLQVCITVLVDYVCLMQDRPDETDPALIESRRKRPELLEALDNALQCCDQMEELSDATVLRVTLEELRSRVAGDYTEGMQRFFYRDLLRGNLVLLDENSWLPVLEEIPVVENFSILDRIARHSREALPDFEAKLHNILGGEEDYGTGKMILQLMEFTHPEMDLSGYDLEASMKYAADEIKIKKEDFIAELALAQSEGKITDDDRKEEYARVILDWYDRTLASRNYGFFGRIMDAIRTSISRDGECRAKDLKENLELYLNETPDWESTDEIRTAVQRFWRDIEVQNYAAAEDQLNRLKSKDLSTYSEPFDTDHLVQFLDGYTANLNRFMNTSGRETLESVLTSFGRSHNKEGRGAAKLLASWPKGNPVRSNTIADLMENLGFHVKCIENISDEQRGAVPMFKVHLKHSVNSAPVIYTHPIYMFGSQAEEENSFQVVCLFGKYDAQTLLDKFESLGSMQNTLILLDYALTLPERRKLARLSKKDGKDGKTVAVIDRIVIAYLVQHYSETAINRMLMSLIIPFAACQPYVPDSSNPMPQEMFIGRRDELNDIKAPNGANIVYGGRQLGKSALLRMAKQDVDHDRNGDRAVWVDLYKLDYKAAARKITQYLCDEGILTESDITEDWNQLARSVRKRLRSTEDRIPYLLLLLDEADAFLKSCETVDYTPLNALKEIQTFEPNRFKFVVAGLRDVVRFNRKVLDNDTVLPHMSSLTVKPFNSVEAMELLEMPLHYLGFRFNRDEETQRLISTILDTTNRFPGILQLYGAKLIEAMRHDYAGYNENKTPPYYVSQDHIKKTLADDTLRNEIFKKFDITLRVGDDAYYYIIALLGAYRYYCYGSRSFSAQEIYEDACYYGISKLETLSVQSTHALMEEMRELNVLQIVTDGYYRFTRENFRVMMGTQEAVMDKIEEVTKNG